MNSRRFTVRLNSCSVLNSSIWTKSGSVKVSETNKEVPSITIKCSSYEESDTERWVMQCRCQVVYITLNTFFTLMFPACLLVIAGCNLARWSGRSFSRENSFPSLISLFGFRIKKQRIYCIKLETKSVFDWQRPTNWTTCQRCWPFPGAGPGWGGSNPLSSPLLTYLLPEHCITTHKREKTSHVIS